MNRRPALALAAMLAATVLTGGAAILGMAHTPTLASSPAVVQTVQPTQQNWERGD
jgi:ABC-type proline/glycine betaine transport system substrate-binding protein